MAVPASDLQQSGIAGRFALLEYHQYMGTWTVVAYANSSSPSRGVPSISGSY